MFWFIIIKHAKYLLRLQYKDYHTKNTRKKNPIFSFHVRNMMCWKENLLLNGNRYLCMYNMFIKLYGTYIILGKKDPQFQIARTSNQQINQRIFLVVYCCRFIFHNKNNKQTNFNHYIWSSKYRGEVIKVQHIDHKIKIKLFYDRLTVSFPIFLFVSSFVI